MVIEASVGGVTMTVAEPCMEPKVAKIEVFPRSTPVTRPLVGITLLTTAIPLFPEVQLT
jgi:hypothetical protein